MPFNCSNLNIPDVKVIEPTRYEDVRGIFSEVWSVQSFSALGLPTAFAQDNYSISYRAKTVRGLHLQIGASAQGKLVRVLRGAIWDVAVDVRPQSPTFGQHAAIELSATNWLQLWIPPGFLHGYCTLESTTEVLYKVTTPYDPHAERGVFWKDPSLSLPWPISEHEAILSDRDASLPSFSDHVGALLRPR